jgi:hypothetical protein
MPRKPSGACTFMCSTDPLDSSVARPISPIPLEAVSPPARVLVPGTRRGPLLRQEHEVTGLDGKRQ